MAHDHAGHTHGVGPDTDRRRLAVALALILALMAGEVGAGVIAHSLALLSDAGHMLTDAAAIGASLLALSLAARPPGGALTFGLKRVEILSAQANGVTLLSSPRSSPTRPCTASSRRRTCAPVWCSPSRSRARS